MKSYEASAQSAMHAIRLFHDGESSVGGTGEESDIKEDTMR